ncbi:hypothetical protein ABW21_db0201636 [Orbilia brochopaga]|nr:hypothetical protein ABW21_db0201636 [Drechslerella brochopaga]
MQVACKKQTEVDQLGLQPVNLKKPCRQQAVSKSIFSCESTSKTLDSDKMVLGFFKSASSGSSSSSTSPASSAKATTSTDKLQTQTPPIISNAHASAAGSCGGGPISSITNRAKHDSATAVNNNSCNTSPPLTPTSATAPFDHKTSTSPPLLPPSPLPSSSTPVAAPDSSTADRASRLLSSLSTSFLQLSLTKSGSSGSQSSTSAKRPKPTSRAESTSVITTASAVSSHGNSLLASSPACPPPGLTEPSTAPTATSYSTVVVTPHKSRLTPNSTDAQTNSATDLLRMAMAQNSSLMRLENEDEVSGQRTPRPDFQDRRIPAILHGFQQQGSPVTGSLLSGQTLYTSIYTVASTTSNQTASTVSPNVACNMAQDGVQELIQNTVKIVLQDIQQDAVRDIIQDAVANDIKDSPRNTTHHVPPYHDQLSIQEAIEDHARDNLERQGQELYDEVLDGFSEIYENLYEDMSDVFLSNSDIDQPLSLFDDEKPRHITSGGTASVSNSSDLSDLEIEKSDAEYTYMIHAIDAVLELTHDARTLMQTSSDLESAFIISSFEETLEETHYLRTQMCEMNEKLTLNDYDSKDTPPATPRGTTSEGKALAPLDTKVEKTSETPNAATSPVTRSPKGKITVRIIAGRNLRTTPASPNGPKDPYIVCTFESNEFISKGPQKKEDGTGKPVGIPGIRGISIPMKSRTSSSTDLVTLGKRENGFTSPSWDHEAIFDVVQEHSEIVIAIYDRENQENFLGMARMKPLLKDEGIVIDEWFPLQPRTEEERALVTGEIQLQVIYEKTAKKHYGPNDFQILRLIGRGTFGQVYQVRKKDTNRIYAMKVLSKKVIVQKKEVAHTIGERNILVRTATTDSPFIVGLKFSFQTPTDLFLVTDYMSGGELFWHLQQEGRFSEERAKFYIAELILALEHLHRHDIVYRDLKPENILLDANGHIALCDFGLSKSNLRKNETTNTFCGTTEYLAPEVLLDELGYTKMVDFWSLGVLVFEMCCGWSPFFAEDTQQMYKNIAFGKVRFPKDALSLEGRNFVKGLLNRNPKHRLGAHRDAAELKEHAFFADVDWEALRQKRSIPPFKPTLKSETDTQNFDTEFTNAPIPGSVRNDIVASTPLSPRMQSAFRGFTFVDERSLEEQFGRSYQSVHEPEDRMEEDSDDDEDDPAHYVGRHGTNGRPGVAAKNDDEGMFASDNIDV